MRADNGGVFYALIKTGRKVDIGSDIPIHIAISKGDALHFGLL
jgi:hypothetical protein